MKLNDNIKDLTVKYIYVEKWNWLDVISGEIFGGHPIENCVYRSVYNKKTKSHRLILSEGTANSPKDAILIKNFNQSNEIEGYTCQLTEITKSNLLNINLNETEVDKLHDWTQSNNDDLKGHPQPDEAGLIRLKNAMLEQEMEDKEYLENLFNVATKLLSVNSDYFKILIEIGDLMTESTLIEHDGPVEALSISETGMSLNIGETLKALKSYTSNNRRTNLDREQLHDALMGIVRELNRRNILEID